MRGAATDPMGIAEIILLFGVGALTGAMNAIVGGGTLICFPILLALGLPPVAANATNTIGLWPASVMAAHIYRPELRKVRAHLLSRSLVALAGGTVGAVLLILLGDDVFSQLVPWLILTATLLYGFSGRIVRLMARTGGHLGAGTFLVLEFLFAIYGGYFGAGIGILLMATMALAGERDPQLSNAQKNLMAGLINGAAVVVFIVQGAVVWPVALALIAGALTGGNLGARTARHIPAVWLRICVLAAGTVLTLFYFYRVYLY